MRDRTTKALVRLYENRLDEYTNLLNRFWDVNDPYVLERLLAASYGSAMRSERLDGLRELADVISSQVFRAGKILPQVSTRDHARGIIECARHRSVVAADAFPESRPPYFSKWPNTAIPPGKALEKWGEQSRDKSDAAWPQREVYISIMSVLSDFSQYVIGDLTEWTAVRRGTTSPKTIKERYEEFLSQLTPPQRTAVEQHRMVSDKVRLYRALLERRSKHSCHRFTAADLEAMLAKAELDVTRSLKTTAEQRHFHAVVKAYTEDSHQFRLPYPFDGSLARRWMIKRVIDYGWTVEKFGEFDRSVNQWSRHGREANKPERIGKKYQWIAFHELLARLSDNFYMRKDPYSDEKLVEYSGPWDIRVGSVRDIDPSVVIRTTQTDSKMSGRCWWSPVPYTGWNASMLDADWIRASDDLPSIEPMLVVRSPDDGAEWCVLDTHCEWQQAARPGRKEYEQPQRRLSYIIRSYLVRRSDTRKFFNWAKRQDFMSGWMPEPGHFFQIHLGEYAWAPAFRETYNPEGWTRGSFDELPVEVMVTATNFLYESSGFDYSIDDTIRIVIPAVPLLQGMRLHGIASEGQFVDSSDRVGAFDPSVRLPGPGALLVRRDALREYLADDDLDLCWTVLGEKQLIGGGDGRSAGWLQVSGVYRLMGADVVGHSTPEYRTMARERPLPRKRT